MRAFESAARHLHFGKAGRELGVTQSAISHQIRSLEERLDILLFERSGNRLALTPAGKSLLEKSSDAFDRLIVGIERLAPDNIAGKLTIGCTTTLLVSLVLDMMARFRKTYPEVSFEVVEIMPRQRDIPTEIELAFCFGEPQSKSRQVEALLREDIFPVASPGLLQNVPTITRPTHLMRLPLLHDNLGHWDQWLSAVGLRPSDFKTNLGFFNTFVTLAATRRGLGVALATRLEVQNDLVRGTLVKVLEKNIPEPDQYYLLTHFPEHQTARARLFERWLRDELLNLYNSGS
ncbi:MAG: LysR family transcriptional regulator [Gammaproteobacteria bacterium]|nr:LysR family transcriptional regulator [Gammaproteobacteria bacterium]